MLKITKAVPNPVGKDKVAYFAPNHQLVNEFFQIENVGIFAVDVGNTVFSHLTWDGWQITGEEKLGWFARGLILQPGEALRVHSGYGVDSRENGIVHVYRNAGNYVLNNHQGDRITLRDSSGKVLDSAWYAPYPAEGEVLLRVA